MYDQFTIFGDMYGSNCRDFFWFGMIYNRYKKCAYLSLGFNRYEYQDSPQKEQVACSNPIAIRFIIIGFTSWFLRT